MTTTVRITGSTKLAYYGFSRLLSIFKICFEFELHVQVSERSDEIIPGFWGVVVVGLFANEILRQAGFREQDLEK